MPKSLKFYVFSKPGCPLQSVTMKSLYRASRVMTV